MEELTLSSEASHVSPCQLLESGGERKILAGYGLSLPVSSAPHGPLGCLRKMLKTQSEQYWTASYLIWKTSVTKSGRTVQRLTAPVRGSKERAYLSWPRPTTGAPLCGGTHNFRQMQRLAEAGEITGEERENLTSGGGGKSNPALMEWLMGFPIGWTDLER